MATGYDEVRVYGEVGEADVSSGSSHVARLSPSGELMTSNVHGKYYEQVNNRHVFGAYAIVTAPVIWSTATATGGPLIWNPSTSSVNVVLLKAGIGSTVVTTVAASLGITGNAQQSVVPTSTTAIDGRNNCYIGGVASEATPYRIGTPAVAGSFFVPFADVHTGALTVDNTGGKWIDLDGLFVAPPGTWISIAAGATASTLVANLSLVWEEVAI